MSPAFLLYSLLRLALLVFWLTVVAGAIRRRLFPAAQRTCPLDRVLSRALWVLAWSAAAFVTATGVVFLNMLLQGPRRLDSLLILLSVTSAVAVTISASICGIRASHEQRLTDE